jgi:hypothetical protein
LIADDPVDVPITFSDPNLNTTKVSFVKGLNREVVPDFVSETDMNVHVGQPIGLCQMDSGGYLLCNRHSSLTKSGFKIPSVPR